MTCLPGLRKLRDRWFGFPSETGLIIPVSLEKFSTDSCTSFAPTKQHWALGQGWCWEMKSVSRTSAVARLIVVIVVIVVVAVLASPWTQVAGKCHGSMLGAVNA
jgi:hypothetical protein